jgi:AraC-like DNA-binding protein
MEILLWIGFAQSLFSATLFLLFKKEKSLSNHILSAWLFIIALEFLSTALDQTFGKWHMTNPFLIFNPLIYFYSKSLINPGLKLKWKQLWHVAPYLFVKTEAYIAGIQLNFNDFFTIDASTWFKIIYGSISVLSFIGYSIPSLVIIHRYRINIKNEFSTIDRKITLGWLLFVIIFYMIFMVTSYLLGMIKIFTHSTTYALLITYAFLLVMVYIFSFYGLLQQQIYALGLGLKDDKYKNPRLNHDIINELKEKLTALFNEKKPYLNSDLTVYIVSDQLNISRHTLTEVLNTGLGKNFYQFVNEFRVEEAIRKLKDPGYNKYSIEAIGFECGFNSRSSFYDVFKRHTGRTPSQFKSSLDQ